MHVREEVFQDLPAVDSVLAVCAHPDDESFGLGAVLSAFAERGVRRELEPLEFVHAEEREREIVKGTHHTGVGSVVQVIARKRA